MGGASFPMTLQGVITRTDTCINLDYKSNTNSIGINVYRMFDQIVRDELIVGGKLGSLNKKLVL